MEVFVKVESEERVHIDEWVPKPEDEIIKDTKGALIIPVSLVYNANQPSFDRFIVSRKKCYNKDDTRQHIKHYLNYFLKYYDQDKELIMIYAHIKYLIDLEPRYDKNAFMFDIMRYVLSLSIRSKVWRMNNDNYSLNLNKSNKSNNKNPNLQYNDKHGKVLMFLSVLVDIVIPLVSHFIYKRGITNVDSMLLEVYDKIIHLDMFTVDIGSKLYETSLKNILDSQRDHPLLWEKQDIRGINPTTLAMGSVENILINILPKYLYNQNIAAFNYQSVIRNIGFKVIAIGYEFDFFSLSSSKRDQSDNGSEFDRFENNLTKENEALYLQNKVNCSETMKMLSITFPIEQEEIDFVTKELTIDNRFSINPFQRELVFNLFYRYFGDVNSIESINKTDYVKLIIIAKRILTSHNLVILPHIIGGRVNKLAPRKNVNKRELERIERSPYYTIIRNKYMSDKLEQQILAYIATILSSDFRFIDFNDKELNGRAIEVIDDIICEEILLYASFI